MAGPDGKKIVRFLALFPIDSAKNKMYTGVYKNCVYYP